MWQMHNPLLRRRVASRHGRRRATSTGTRRGVEAARRVPAHRALEPFSNPGTRTGAEVLFGARACRGNGAAGQPAAKRPTRARRHKARSRPARGGWRLKPAPASAKLWCAFEAGHVKGGTWRPGGTGSAELLEAGANPRGAGSVHPEPTACQFSTIELAYATRRSIRRSQSPRSRGAARNCTVAL